MENMQSIAKILIFMAATVGVISVVIYIIGLFRQPEQEEKKEDMGMLREVSLRDQRIRELQSEVQRLNELNSRYLVFMLNIPTVVMHLNSTLDFDEIASTIIRLVRDIIATDTVELYIFDKEAELLKRVSPDGKVEENITYALGEGLIGRAGQHRMLRIRGRGDEGYSGKKGKDQAEPNIYMAAPIHFSNRLLGVIGAGEIRNPSGNEGSLLKMIADIAGVALFNQKFLSGAKKKAEVDPLTGLYNRRYFFHMVQKFVEKSILEDTPISIFLFDIDNFKHYNDTNGHAEGDKLLKELSELVAKFTRKTSVVARYGGEEFIVMLPEISKEEAFVYAERVREMIASHPFAHREKQPLGIVSISGGVASFPADGRSIHEVIQLADAALYQAKRDGRNRVIMHKPFMFSDVTSED
ncbi:MAG: sensor domain-containing diguanylate cyclase [Nitrospirae bacterium]|nr:sensor domain-containing diguanylate cyclase [Nitrospirota bacterium]